jgi:hypothetical protein
MSDLVSIIKWLSENDDHARSIGYNGRLLAYKIDYETELGTAIDTVGAAFRAFSAMRQSTGHGPYGQISVNAVSTCHGTYFAYDLEQKRLLHVKPELFLLNARFQPISTLEIDGSVYLCVNGKGYIISIKNDGLARLAQERRDTCDDRFEMILQGGKSDGRFSLRSGESFLCADDGGLLTVSRRSASDWEIFKSDFLEDPLCALGLT